MPSGAERRAPFWVLMAITLVVDRITKILAEGALGSGRIISVIGETARFSLVHNRGAAFGINLGSASRWVFLGIAIVAVPVLYKLWQQAPLNDRMRQYALGFVAGGAVGNGIDRVLSARGVTDFIDVGLASVRWPTFNVADIAVSCGAVVLALTLWREDSQRAKQPVAPVTESAPVLPEGAGSPPSAT